MQWLLTFKSLQIPGQWKSGRVAVRLSEAGPRLKLLLIKALRKGLAAFRRDKKPRWDAMMLLATNFFCCASMDVGFCWKRKVNEHNLCMWRQSCELFKLLKYKWHQSEDFRQTNWKFACSRSLQPWWFHFYCFPPGVHDLSWVVPFRWVEPTNYRSIYTLGCCRTTSQPCLAAEQAAMFMKPMTPGVTVVISLISLQKSNTSIWIAPCIPQIYSVTDTQHVQRKEITHRRSYHHPWEAEEGMCTGGASLAVGLSFLLKDLAAKWCLHEDSPERRQISCLEVPMFASSIGLCHVVLWCVSSEFWCPRGCYFHPWLLFLLSLFGNAWSINSQIAIMTFAAAFVPTGTRFLTFGCCLFQVHLRSFSMDGSNHSCKIPCENDCCCHWQGVMYHRFLTKTPSQQQARNGSGL